VRGALAERACRLPAAAADCCPAGAAWPCPTWAAPDAVRPRPQPALVWSSAARWPRSPRPLLRACALSSLLCQFDLFLCGTKSAALPAPAASAAHLAGWFASARWPACAGPFDPRRIAAAFSVILSTFFVSRILGLFLSPQPSWGAASISTAIPNIAAFLCVTESGASACPAASCPCCMYRQLGPRT
jgi:hypothetical protein